MFEWAARSSQEFLDLAPVLLIFVINVCREPLDNGRTKTKIPKRSPSAILRS